ncbi:hypothetical protein L9F63_021893, partial [Diploptera punctata]
EAANEGRFCHCICDILNAVHERRPLDISCELQIKKNTPFIKYRHSHWEFQSSLISKFIKKLMNFEIPEWLRQNQERIQVAGLNR